MDRPIYFTHQEKAFERLFERLFRHRGRSAQRLEPTQEASVFTRQLVEVARLGGEVVLERRRLTPTILDALHELEPCSSLTLVALCQDADHALYLYPHVLHAQQTLRAHGVTLHLLHVPFQLGEFEALLSPPRAPLLR